MMTKVYFIAVLLGFACFLGNSFAEEVRTSWRLQGPAFSYHFSNKGAPVRSSNTVNDGNNAIAGSDSARAYSSSFPIRPGESARSYCQRFTDSQIAGASGPIAEENRRRVQNSCLSHLSSPYVVEHRRWNQTNLELGIEQVRRATSHVERFYGGVVIDSYFKPSVYIGTSLQKSVYSDQIWQIDAGATGFLWWRSVPDNDGNLHKRLVPGVLPVLTVEHKPLGVGMNLTMAPAIRRKGVQYTVTTLMLQVTWAL